jgi:hypothetical protein
MDNVDQVDALVQEDIQIAVTDTASMLVLWICVFCHSQGPQLHMQFITIFTDGIMKLVARN